MAILNQTPGYILKNLPSGCVLPFGHGTLPEGFLACDGSAVSRSSYASLFAVIGTTFGVGDGSTTFNLPDLRGIFPRGVGSQTVSAVLYDGSTLGTKRKDRTNNTGLSASTSSTNSATVDNFNAAHTHSWSDRFFNGSVSNFSSYSNGAGFTHATNYTNVETARTTGNPSVSLNHNHSVATNTVSSSSSFNGEDANTVPGYLTVNFMIRV